MSKKRTIIVGLDGVPYGMIDNFANSGVMKNVKKLIEAGIFKPMRSSIPEISSVAWSSIITGANPAEHGIFGFTDFPQGTYRLSFPNFNSLKVSPFWQRDGAGRSIIINVPSTYPARKLNGVLISGFVALDLERATYPDSLLPQLKEMNYKVDVESEKAHQSMELFLKDLFLTLEKRVEACRCLWSQEWQTFMFVVTGTDRLMHFLMEAYEDPEHKHHAAFVNYFERVDEAIGEIVSKTTEDDTIIMLSDHGFEALDSDVYVNLVLQESGLLKLGDNPRLGFGNIGKGTKAFALDPARIYINTTGKYPRGAVEATDREKLMKDLEELFGSLELNGKKVIRKIYKKEQVFKGPFLDQAPDLVLIGNQGFNLKASLAGKGVFSRGVFTGKHTQHDAFLGLNKRVAGLVPESPNVCDITKIIERSKFHAQ